MKKVVVALLLLASCSLPSEKHINPSSLLPSVNEGRLKFSSPEDIANFINKFTLNKNADAAIAQLKKYNSEHDFSSHYDRIVTFEESQDARTENEDVVTDDIGIAISPFLDSLRLSPIIDPRLSSILNEKRELEIDNNTIIRFQNDFTFLYQNGKFDVVKDFYSTLKQGGVIPPTGFTSIDFKGVKIYKTQITFNGNIASDLKISGRTQGSEYNCDVRSADDWWRIYGRAYTIWNGVYSSAGLECHSQTKRRKCRTFSGCWYSWDVEVAIPTISVNFDVWVILDAPVDRITLTRIGTNTSSVGYFFGEVSGFAIPAFKLSGWYCTNGVHNTYGKLECSSSFINYPYLTLNNISCP